MKEYKIGFKKYQLDDEITEVENGTTQNLYYKSKRFVLKKYTSSDAFFDELDRYNALIKSGIRIPKIIYKNKKEKEIIYSYLEGERVDKILFDTNFDLPDIYYERLFVVYRFCRFCNIELNYLPENFVLINNLLYYDSFEIYERNEKINLENYGLYYWIQSLKAYEHLEKLGYKFDKKSALSNGEANKKIVLLSIKYW